MSLVFTQLAADNFTPNANPLNPANWTTATDQYGPLKSVSGFAEAASLVMDGSGSNYTGVLFPNNQYVQVTLNLGVDDEVDICIRVDAAGDHEFAIDLQNNNDGTAAFSIDDSNGLIAGTLIPNLPVANGDVWLIAAIGQTIYVYHNGLLLSQAVSTDTSTGPYPGLYCVQPATSFSHFSAGMASLATPAGMQPIPFSKRTTAAVAVFSCIFIASPMQGARQFTTDVPTISELQLEYAQFINLYPQLLHQDVANQQVVLDGLIAQALTIVTSLNATLSGMVATGDALVQLNIMKGIVSSALASLKAVQSDE